MISMVCGTDAVPPRPTTQQREIAETVFERNIRREAEINDVLKQKHARREAAVKNMYRLRALRLARDGKTKVK